MNNWKPRKLCRSAAPWRANWWLLVPSLLTMVLIGGCGGGTAAKPTGKVTGKVTLGNAPLDKGRIAFSASALGTASTANLAADGGYVINELQTGEYKVFFIPRDLGDVPPGLPGQNPPPEDLSKIPAKNRSEAQTDLKATVKAGSNEINFDLKP